MHGSLKSIKTLGLYPADANVLSINVHQRTRLATLLFPHVEAQDELLPDHLFVAHVLDRYLEKLRPAVRRKRRK